MLKKLVIENFVLVTFLELQFDTGLRVLTGESGAGKSILIDALLLLLGGRTDTSFIRENTTQTTLSAVFEIQDNLLINQWLINENLQKKSKTCEIKRSISIDGKSRCWINQKSVSLSKLKEFSDFLVDIHGQHAHQKLLKSEIQRDLLDQFAEHDYLLQVVESAFNKWQDAKKHYEFLKNQIEHSEMLKFQLNEKLNTWKDYQNIKINLDLKDESWEDIEQYFAKLSHNETLVENSKNAYELLMGLENHFRGSSKNKQQSLIRLLDVVKSNLIEILDFDKNKINPIISLLDQAEIHLQEAGDELQNYRKQLSFDPEYLSQLQEYIHNMERFAYQNHILPQDLEEESQKWQQTLNSVPTEEDLLDVSILIKQLEKEYLEVAKQLTASREQFAPIFSEKVTELIKNLAMSHGRFEVQLIKSSQPHKFGVEHVHFAICMHSNATPKSLTKVASGGELSRISLAIQAISSQKNSAPTLIFDEVDVGIGGATADQVGQLLRHLSEKRQILCITHLSQVAICGHQHYRIEKNYDEISSSMVSDVQKLSKKQRVDEIARMLGGSEITSTTLTHAKELLKKFIKS